MPRPISLTICNVRVQIHLDDWVTADAGNHPSFPLGTLAKGRPGDAPKLWHVTYPDGTEAGRYYATRKAALEHMLFQASKGNEALRVKMGGPGNQLDA